MTKAGRMPALQNKINLQIWDVPDGKHSSKRREKLIGLYACKSQCPMTPDALCRETRPPHWLPHAHCPLKHLIAGVDKVTSISPFVAKVLREYRVQQSHPFLKLGLNQHA